VHASPVLIRFHKAAERRHARTRAKETWCTFGSTAAAFGALERLDEHILGRGAAIVTRGDDDSELVTYVHSGALARTDTTGRAEIVSAGEVRITTTPRHARDTNALAKDVAHGFRISIASWPPVAVRHEEQKRFSAGDRRGRMCLVVSPDARAGSLLIHQDAFVYSAILATGQHVVHALGADRIAWVHVVVGEVTLGDVPLCTGDGAGVSAERALSLTSQESSEILVVDLVRC
jgi:quercetin 2,3-dioxygenase